MQKPIFRRVALERLSSPEQLDQLIPATTLRSWLAPAARAGDSQPRTRSPRRVRVPTILQMEAVECGAASLAMVLAYHGRHVPLEELRLACGVSRDGTKASNLVKAARRYGLKAKGFSLEPLQLRELPLPLIVFWNFNHFVVVEGFGKNRVALNDPAVGPRAVTPEEFDLSFTGVALALEPGPDFVRGGQRRHWLAALRPRLSGAQAALAFVVIAGLALVVPGLVIPTLIRAFVDDYLVKGLSEWVLPILGLMGLATLLSAGLTWLQQTVLLRLEHRLASNTARTFFWHVLRLPIEFFTQRYGGEVGSRVALNDLVANLLSERLATTLLNVVLIIFFGGLMFRYSPLLTLVSAAMLALNLIALQQVSRRRVDGNRQLLQESGKLLGTALNGLQMIETLKAIGAEADFFTRWAGQQAKVENARQSLAVSTQFLAAIPPLLTALNLALILGLGAWQVMTGALTIGMWVAFQSLLVSFLGPVNSLVLLGHTLQEVEGHVNRLEDVWHYPIDPQVEQPKADGARPVRSRTRDAESGDPGGDLTGLNNNPVPRLTGHIELREVTFGYSRLEPPLIDKLNLRLKPGDRVALVGASGSGKSTVARLVAGLFEPWSGEILFDGQPRSSWPRAALNAAIALVDQDLCLFEGTLHENLTLWDTSIPEAAMRQAAHDACLHEEITTRPGEYETWIEESGRNFSGGQRQRLEIAQALATNPSILILDEATSALDALTEQRVDEQLRRRGCTCLIIAHRLSTIRDCDEIIVLDRGRVVQRGTHAEMADQPGMYRQLIATE